MNTINVATWNRKEHFNFFSKMDLPFYNVNFNLDITGLRGMLKANSLSFNTSMIYFSLCALCKVENFRYRYRSESTVQVHDHLNPAFAHIFEGEDLFRMITVEFCSDLVDFDKRVRDKINNSQVYFDLSMLSGRDDFVFFSALPWIEFTGVDHTMSLKKFDTIPRITWGKYFEDNQSVKLPFNIQVNHIFIDGIHVGRFIEQLREEIRVFNM